ncbi:MAG: hypothetical protein RBR64_04825, partial [Bacteroidales bacterium]|nr:hypothetical protein [Bacteroidales bacterium]
IQDDMKKLFLVLSFALFCSAYSYSQCLHVVFEDKLFNSKNNICQQHLLLLSENIVLNFTMCEKHIYVDLAEKTYNVIDSIKPNNNAKLVNTKNKSFIDINLNTYKKDTGYTDFYFLTKCWNSQSKEVKSHTGKEYEEFVKNTGLINDSNNYEIDIEYLKEEKQIGNYLCRKANLNYYGKEYTLWYTEEIDYNKAFVNFLYKVPGTVVQIGNKDDIVFKLISVREFDITKTNLSYQVLFKIQCGLEK